MSKPAFSMAGKSWAYKRSKEAISHQLMARRSCSGLSFDGVHESAMLTDMSVKSASPAQRPAPAISLLTIPLQLHPQDVEPLPIFLL